MTQLNERADGLIRHPAPLALYVMALLVVMVACLSDPTGLPGSSLNDKLVHATTYFTLALLSRFAFSARVRLRPQLLFLLGWGVLIEVLQAFHPLRTFSILDMIANGAGLLIFWLGYQRLARLPATETP